MKEKDVLPQKEVIGDGQPAGGDSFLAQKQKEKRERDRLREKENEQSKELLRNKLNNAGDSKSVENLRTKKRESYGSTHSLPNRQSAVNIPQFYFPLGQPATESLDAVQLRIKEEFAKADGGQLNCKQLGPVMKVSTIFI